MVLPAAYIAAYEVAWYTEPAVLEMQEAIQCFRAVKAGFKLGSKIGFAIDLGAALIDGFSKMDFTKNSTTMSRTPSRGRSVSRGKRRSSVYATPKSHKKRRVSKSRSRSRSVSRGRRSYRSRETGSNPRRRIPSTPPQISGNDQIQGINTEMYKVSVGCRRNKSKSIGKWDYRTTYQGITTSGVGSQGVNDMFQLATYDQFFNNAGNGFLSYQTFNALLEMNPYSKITGSGLWTAGGVIATSKFKLKSVIVNLDISNFGDSACMADIYLFKTKDDLPVGETPKSVWTKQMLVEGQSIAVAGIPTLAATNTAGSINILQPSVVPSEAVALKKIWKGLGRKYINLAAGASENLTFEIDFGTLIDEAKLKEVSTQYLKGLSLSFMIVQRGSLAKDSVNSRATYSNTELGWVAEVRYNMGAVKDNAGRLDVAYGANSITNNTIVQQSQVFTQLQPKVL